MPSLRLVPKVHEVSSRCALGFLHCDWCHRYIQPQAVVPCAFVGTNLQVAFFDLLSLDTGDQLKQYNGAVLDLHVFLPAQSILA
jgi:hypothetical protein